MIVDFGEFTWVQWILTGLLVVVGASSSVAAWYGAIISRRNQKRLARQESVALQVKADHTEYSKPNQTRNIDEERVSVRLFNKGRPLQIEAFWINPIDRQNWQESFSAVYKDRRASSKPLDLQTHKTEVLKVKVRELLELEDLAFEKKPVRVRLSDGETLELKCEGFGEIIDKLCRYKSDREKGYILELRSVMVYQGGTGRSIEGWKGPIPEDARIGYSDVPPGYQENVSPEDEAIWRAGRNPQREAIDRAAAKRNRVV